MFGTTPGISGIGAPPSTAPFLPIYNGPEADGLIGFIQEHTRGFKAFDGGKIFLDVLKDQNSACDAIWADCLGIKSRSNGGDLQAFDTRSFRLPETPKLDPASNVQDVIAITELEPANGAFIGKHVNRGGSLTEYPRVTWWRQSVARVQATIPHLFAYLREARKRNICLIRGAPANLERQPTRRWKAGVVGKSDRGDHGFVDMPTRLFFLDVDGMQIDWLTDPEQAIRAIVAQLGEPWASTSFVWFFSAKHGLEFIEVDERKHWTGKIIDGKLYARIVFITERTLNEAEAGALTNIAKAFVSKLDTSISRQVQPNYIARPHWVEHPNRDVLGDIPTIGWVKGTSNYLAVPDELTYTARWAKAQGHGTDVADHPDTESAVRGIGSDGRVRQHLKAAVEHLLRANPVPEVVSFADHSIVIVDKLQKMLAQHREEIEANLARNNRHWSDVLQHLSGMPDWARWLLDHPTAFKRKTIKLAKQEQAKADNQSTGETIFARVARTIARARPAANEGREMPPVTLLVAPTGSRKSTLLRRAAVLYVTEHPDKTVVILVPRHKLGDEQIDRLRSEHPDGNYSAAVWRGRHADDPETRMKMCRRAAAAAMVEDVMIDVESSLCKRGRGDKAIKCPHFDICAYQRQKQTKANIWFAAHECAAHEMPEVFGDVGWVIFDESPLDAFMFGVDVNDQITLGLDTLRTPLPGGRTRFGGGFDRLMEARNALHHALDELRVPIELHQGAPVPRQSLKAFVDATVWRGRHARDMRRFTFRGKVDPKIRPDVSDEQLKIKLEEAAGNDTIKKEVTLWELIEAAGSDVMKKREAALWEQTADLTLSELIEAVRSIKHYGRIQIHRGKAGRIIRMVGLKLPAKGKPLTEGKQGRPEEKLPAKEKTLAKGWNVPTLICDATGDAELLRAIWPQLEELEPHGWEQLPRPESVRVFQCVDRTISKWAVAVEGKNEKEIARKIEGARRLYAAVLTKAFEYGGADVGVIVYKSTREWIEKNCFVPDWLKLMHWGDVTGTNALQRVRALFVIGRPLASPEAVAQQTEALFGAYIPQRDYVTRRKQGRIPIVPDAAGNTCVLVDVREHPHPMGERVRRQVTEAAIIQAVGRARAGLRKADEPLDIHLWTDVPVPELGPVTPVLWGDLGAGLDGLMLAVAGCWLKNIADAVRAFGGVFSARGLETARAAARAEAHAAVRGVHVLHIGIPICRTWTPHTILPPARHFTYQRAGAGHKPAEAVFLKGVADPRGWLEARLGPLAYFEVVAWGEKDEAV